MTRVLAILGVVLLGGAATGAQPTGTRRPLPLPAVNGYHVLKADLHLHSVFSDGEVWPTVHVREAWRDGLDVVALTEHLEYRPHRADVSGGARRAYEVARPLADQLGMILVPAVEITRPVPGQPSAWPVGSAHFNALFVRDEAPLGDDDLTAALRAARAQGAYVFWNHPSFMGRPAEWYPHVAALFEQGLFSGIEVVNGDDYSPDAFAWALERNLAVLACSDAHLPMPAHLRSARRPVTILFASSRDETGVREALAQGRTLAWLDDKVWGAERWLRALWSGAVRVSAVAVRGSEVVLQAENLTALDLEVDVVSAPSWLVLPSARLRAQSTTALTARLGPDAPAGAHRVTTTVRVRNLHPAPGQALEAQLTFEVHISR